MNTTANHPNGFSLTIARDLAMASAGAYSPVIRAQFLAVLEVPDLSQRAVITWHDDHTEIAIRGTANLEDWILDLDVFKAHLAYGVEVHAGFLAAADALLPLILKELLPAGTDKAAMKPIYVTGHSLGGAVASLIALFLQHEGLPVVAVYTFASPRVGNREWRAVYSEALGHCSYRVIAEGDLVPLLPGLMDGYRHVGQEIMLTPHGIYARPAHWWELMHGSWRVLCAMNRLDAACLVKFHSITRDYLPLLS